MNYKEQLTHIKWKDKRNEIVERDGHICQNCNNESLIHSSDKYGHSGWNEIGKGFYAGSNDTHAFYHVDIGKEGVLLPIYSIEKQWILKYTKDLFPFYLKFHLYENGSAAVRFYSNLDFYNPRLLSYWQKIISIQDQLVVSYSEREMIDFPHFQLSKVDRESKRSLSIISEESFNWIYNFNLHVHHKCYRFGRMAWEYDNTDLVSLCFKCHTEFHQQNSVPIYDLQGNLINITLTPCNRCGGSGVFPEYSYVQNGVCFECMGAKFKEWM